MAEAVRSTRYKGDDPTDCSIHSGPRILNAFFRISADETVPVALKHSTIVTHAVLGWAWTFHDH